MREFLIDLYEEHLEEASFLYHQCRHLRRDLEMPWTGVQAFEQRLEAHLDGLVIGGDLALEVCQKKAPDADAGELFAIVAVYCRQGRAPLLAELFKNLQAGDDARLQAVADALSLEMPQAWQSHAARALAQDSPVLTPLLAAVSARRRWAVDGVFARLLPAATPEALPGLLQLCGRVGPSADAQDRQVVRGCLDKPDADVRAAAWQAALRMRDGDAILRTRTPNQQEGLPALAMGLAADRQATLALVERLTQEGVMEDAIMALGLLGDLGAVRPLMRCLGIGDRAEHAAMALHVITGAPLYEEVFVPDEPAEDELLEQEKLDYRAGGQLPKRGDGKTFGSTVRRLSQEPGQWEAWLGANASRFAAGVRYRMGHPLDPGVLLSCLAAPAYPKPYRAVLADELAVRYRIDLPFDVDMLVSQQSWLVQQASAQLPTWATSFRPGLWYADGQPL